VSVEVVILDGPAAGDGWKGICPTRFGGRRTPGLPSIP
jgi:hypothetical protein